MTMKLVPVSEAKAQLTSLVKDSQTEDVTLLRYGRPEAVIISAERYNQISEDLEDLADILAAKQAEDEPTVKAEDLWRALGI